MMLCVDHTGVCCNGLLQMTVDVIFSNCGHRHQNVVTVACHCFGYQTCCNGRSCSLSPALSPCMSTCVLQDFPFHDIDSLSSSNGGWRMLSDSPHQRPAQLFNACRQMCAISSTFSNWVYIISLAVNLFGMSDDVSHASSAISQLDKWHTLWNKTCNVVKRKSQFNVAVNKEHEFHRVAAKMRMQHPDLPVNGYTWSTLMRDSFIRDSFTEDTLLSAWDQLLLALTLTIGEEHCSRE